MDNTHVATATALAYHKALGKLWESTTAVCPRYCKQLLHRNKANMQASLYIKNAAFGDRSWQQILGQCTGLGFSVEFWKCLKPLLLTAFNRSPLAVVLFESTSFATAIGRHKQKYKCCA